MLSLRTSETQNGEIITRDYYRIMFVFDKAGAIGLENAFYKPNPAKHIFNRIHHLSGKRININTFKLFILPP